MRSAYLSVAESNESHSQLVTREIDLVHLAEGRKLSTRIKVALERLGWVIAEHASPFNLVQKKNTVLVIDELACPIFPTIREDQWEALKTLTEIGSRILWVTEGSQLDVTNPSGAMSHGLARTVRAEDPSISLTTLDVENGAGAETATAIHCILKSLEHPAPKTHVENEYVARDGVIHVSRIQPDYLINHAEKEDSHGADLMTMSLHEADTCIRLRCERLGTIDSLCYAEVAPIELPLSDNCVEVELAAAGLNFKVLKAPHSFWVYLAIR